MSSWSRSVAVGALSVAMILTASMCAALRPTDPGRTFSSGTSWMSLRALHAVPDPVHGGRFVDATGRTVILRGVNVNALVDYWRYGAFPTTFPFTEDDARRIAGEGWNVVRLLVSWSRVEPRPGVYDEGYLDDVVADVRLLARHGVYSLVDFHQDAWGATLAARPGEVCAAGTSPAFGWDGAPGWATLDGGAARCALGGVRETSSAVLAAFGAFWSDVPGPGGVGIRTRYAAMVGHVAGRFARDPDVVGYDLMNEPNAYTATQYQGLSDLAGAALADVRSAERAAGGFAHLLFVEPGILWSDLPVGAPPAFPHDSGIVFAPHIYAGGLTSGPIPESDFARARADATTLGGAPVFVGEWGGDPHRTSDPTDDYFLRHQQLQDQYGFSSTLWTWHESCGDPHKAADALAGRVPYVWGEFEVDCTTNTITGLRTDLVAELHHGYVRAAPGTLGSTTWDPTAQMLTASGTDAVPLQLLDAYLPASGSVVHVHATGFLLAGTAPAPGGTRVWGLARGGDWSVRAGP